MLGVAGAHRSKRVGGIEERCRVDCIDASEIGDGFAHLAAEVFEECPALDAIVKGEGEGPLLGILERIAVSPKLWRHAPGLILREGETTSAPPLENLDAVGIPAAHLEADFLDDVGQLAYLSSSRGCPATCNFCNTPEFWGTSIRFRSAESVLREMRLLRPDAVQAAPGFDQAGQAAEVAVEHGLADAGFLQDFVDADVAQTLAAHDAAEGLDQTPLGGEALAGTFAVGFGHAVAPARVVAAAHAISRAFAVGRALAGDDARTSGCRLHRGVGQHLDLTGHASQCTKM